MGAPYIYDISHLRVKQNSTGSLMSPGPLFEFSKLKQVFTFIASLSLHLNIAYVFKRDIPVVLNIS